MPAISRGCMRLLAALSGVETKGEYTETPVTKVRHREYECVPPASGSSVDPASPGCGPPLAALGASAPSAPVQPPRAHVAVCNSSARHKDKEHWRQTAHKLGWTVPGAPGRMQDFSRHLNYLRHSSSSRTSRQDPLFACPLTITSRLLAAQLSEIRCAKPNSGAGLRLIRFSPSRSPRPSGARAVRPRHTHLCTGHGGNDATCSLFRTLRRHTIRCGGGRSGQGHVSRDARNRMDHRGRGAAVRIGHCRLSRDSRSTPPDRIRLAARQWGLHPLHVTDAASFTRQARHSRLRPALCGQSHSFRRLPHQPAWRPAAHQMGSLSHQSTR